MPRTFEFQIEHDDITTFQADVLVLKYAQAFYGADKAVASLIPPEVMQPKMLHLKPGEYRLIETKGRIAAPWVLFVGVAPLHEFRYEQIREFAAHALAILAEQMPEVRHIAMTVHGAASNLDETESLVAQFAGLLDAIQKAQFPLHLEQITIVELVTARVDRLRKALDRYFVHAPYALRVPDKWAYSLTFDLIALSMAGEAELEAETRDGHDSFPSVVQDIQIFETAGTQSESKPHAFIAMPFKKEFDDIFYYGIQQPVHTVGLLCERVDKDAFSGGIMEYVKHRIETAAVVVAELTGANPNVYLEVGYAWGKGRPVILLVQDESQLHFDVKGQRCLVYERIKDLEEALSKELRGMMAKGIVVGQNAR